MRLDTQLATRPTTKMTFLIGVSMYVAGVSAALFGLVMIAVNLPPFPGSFQSASQPPSATTSNSVTLTWTAPGDDAQTGQAAQYDVRYSKTPITEANFNDALSIGYLPPPRAAGLPESYTVNGLQPSTTYYFALKTADESPNWSALSNVVTVTTAAIDAGCTPRWSCTDWTTCKNQSQSRTCIDIADPPCATTLGKPIEQQACTGDPGSGTCTEDWSCTEWAACKDKTQTRTCLDRSACGTTASKPKESAACDTGGPGQHTSGDILVTVPWQGSPAQVRIFNRQLKAVRSFFAFPTYQRRGGTVAVGDTDGDGQWNILAGSGVGAVPELKIWTLTGKLVGRATPFSVSSRTGIQVGSGDVDGDGTADVFAAPAGRATAKLVMLRYKAETRRYERWTNFQPFGSYRGSLSMTFADLNHDDHDELIVAAADRARPLVKVFTYDLQTKRFRLSRTFRVFSGTSAASLQLASGDVDNDGDQEIIVARTAGSPPVVQVYTARGQRKMQFSAASASFRGGVTLATMDTDLDGQDEIITAVEDSGPPGVYVFDLPLGSRRFTRTQSLNVYSQGVNDGLRLATPPDL